MLQVSRKIIDNKNKVSTILDQKDCSFLFTTLQIYLLPISIEVLDLSLCYNQGILALKCPKVFNLVIAGTLAIQFGLATKCRWVAEVDT